MEPATNRQLQLEPSGERPGGSFISASTQQSRRRIEISAPSRGTYLPRSERAAGPTYEGTGRQCVGPCHCEAPRIGLFRLGLILGEHPDLLERDTCPSELARAARDRVGTG